MLVGAVFDGAEYGFRFAYNPLLPPLLKADDELRGFFISDRTHPYYRYWRFPRAGVENLEVFSGWINRITTALGGDRDQLRNEFDEAIRKLVVTPGAFAHGISQTIYPIAHDDFVVIGNKFHGAAIYALRMMGGRWLKSAKGWRISDISPAMLINNLEMQCGYKPEQLMVCPGKFEVIEGGLGGSSTAAITMAGGWLEGGAGAGAGDGATKPALRDDDAYEHESGQLIAVVPVSGRTGLSESQIRKTLQEIIPPENLLEHQVDGVVFCAQREGCLIADEMGTGKTRTGVATAHVLTTLFKGGRSNDVLVVAPATVLYKFANEIMATIPGAKAEVFDGAEVPSSQWVVCNYERLDRIAPISSRFMVMLIDEAHKLKEALSQRTRFAYECAANIPFRYPMSATPILNRESEVHSLLRLSGHPLGTLPMADFKAQFSGSTEFRAAFNKEVATDWMLRRLKSVVLRGKIPGKYHDFQFFDMPADIKEEHDRILKTSTSWLGAIHGVRKLLELARIPFAVRDALNLPPDEKMVVFCWYTESVERYCEELTKATGKRYVPVVGDHAVKRRFETIRSLQEDDEVGGLVASFGSASEGVDMWRANHVFLGNEHWVPGIQDQAEDRTNRLGQTRRVRVAGYLFKGTVDIDIHSMSAEKSVIAMEMLDPEAAEKEAMKRAAQALKSKRNELKQAA